MLDEQLPAIKSVTNDPTRVARLGRRSHHMPELHRLPPRIGDSARYPLIEEDPGDQNPDHLRPFTGVMVAVVLSVPIWIAIAGLLYLFF